MTANGSLEDSLGEHKPQYAVLREHVAGIHRDVTTGASAADGGLLTDHGPEHISTVIARASQLSNCGKCNLTDYEVFLLLAAIHLHDVGNIHGRAGHQLKAGDVAEWLGSSVSRDAIVRRTIVQIAAAHTAGESGDKDTIRRLQPVLHILNNRVRPRLLAAILRFADEIADDRARASRYLLETGGIPTSSEVFHAFAYALHSVVIDHNSREIELHFEIELDQALRMLGKQDGRVFLLDEILARSAKLHRERVYAMLFLRDSISIDAIRVFIEVYGDGLEPVERVGYRLADTGYPEEPGTAIYTVAPELTSYSDWDGVKVTGKALARRISKHENESAN